MSKVMTMKEAISRYVHSGDTLFISGAQHGEPAAAMHEIIRQRIDHLSLICALVSTAGFLVGECLVDTMITGYTPQDEKRSYAMAKAKKQGDIEQYKVLKKQRRRLPRGNPSDPHYRRLRYVRYADDIRRSETLDSKVRSQTDTLQQAGCRKRCQSPTVDEKMRCGNKVTG